MQERREVTAGTGPAGLDAGVVLDLGRHHPSADGGLRLRLTLDGDTIAAADPRVGYVHRGAEKLFEVRDYRQVLVLANRHDWLAAFAGELGVCLTVERMLGLAVPPRATWLRTLLAELTRVHSHLAFLGGFPVEDPRLHPLALGAREQVQAVLEEACGGRLHLMIARVGGLREDVPAGWVERVRAALDDVRRALPEVERRLGDGGLSRYAGVGVLPADLVPAYGVSGPPARASGVDLDLRRDEPYLAYGDLGFGSAFPVVTRTAGDVVARVECLLAQTLVSLDLAEACCAALPSGPVDVRLPKVVRAPEGQAYTWTETPLGIAGWWLVSRGGPTPWRLKLRSASFNTVSALPELLVGARVDQVAPILASLFFLLGDVDR